jgi:hypothetical protein
MLYYQILICDHWMEGEIEPERAPEILNLVDNKSEEPVTLTDGTGDQLRMIPSDVRIACVYDHEKHGMGFGRN